MTQVRERMNVSVAFGLVAAAVLLIWAVLEASNILSSGLAPFGYVNIVASATLMISLVAGLRRRLPWMNLLVAIAACAVLLVTGFITFFEAGYVQMLVTLLAAIGLTLGRLFSP